jgi:hypothetical protein
MTAPQYIKVAHVATQYGISRYKLYRLQNEGRLTIHKLDGAALVKVADLVGLIEGAPA